ncbi:MAG: TnpV protein [Clostridia bacterium]|nr:TnpV protein [Clostridia bacterium]
MTEKLEPLEYTTVGDYQLPNLTVPDKQYEIGKYGQMRRTYLKNHRKGLYTAMLVKGTLLQHLEDTNKEATAMVERIVSKLAQTEGVTEELKARSPLTWTGLMNNLVHSAEETVLRDVVYS